MSLMQDSHVVEGKTPQNTSQSAYQREDFSHSPMLVFYEVTRACNLKCVHCRADAQRYCHPEELTPHQSLQLITQLTTFPKPPLLVLTGGDPMKRRDIFSIIAHARREGLEVAMTPSATQLVTTAAIRQLRASGLHRLAVSLDGADEKTHDDFRRVPGSFERTLRIISDAAAVELPVQINTTLCQHNLHQIEAMAELLDTLPIVMWSVFFLIPTGRGMAQQRLTPLEVEAAFARLYAQMGRRKYAIKTTEAPHFRRYVMQQSQENPEARARITAMGASAAGGASRLVGTNDGKGVMFVSHIGEISPSGFLPIVCGRFPNDSVVDVYQKSPLFVDLRNPDKLTGKCRRCEFREFCGGSRARAHAVTGDPLAAEPDCVYIPPACRT